MWVSERARSSFPGPLPVPLPAIATAPSFSTPSNASNTPIELLNRTLNHRVLRSTQEGTPFAAIYAAAAAGDAPALGAALEDFRAMHPMSRYPLPQALSGKARRPPAVLLR